MSYKVLADNPTHPLLGTLTGIVVEKTLLAVAYNVKAGEMGIA